MPNEIRIIAGLGNPEEQHERTLHNAGFWFADALARKYGGIFRYEKKFDAEYCRVNLHGDDVWLVKPQSFMNLSGGPIRAVLDYYRLRVTGLLVAHDEIDLPPGTTRFKEGGGHGGHNGLRDIINHLGKEFFRLRIGIGHPGDRNQVVNYVLKAPSKIDLERIEDASLQSVNIMPTLLSGEFEKAMQQLHTK